MKRLAPALLLSTLGLAVLALTGCSGGDGDFAHLTPSAEITTYHDTAGICGADSPLVSFWAVLDQDRPLLVREEGLTTYLILPDCSVRQISIDEALVVYQPAEGQTPPSLLLRLNGLERTVTLEELRHGSFALKDDLLALQVVRVSASEISGAVFARYPHSNVAPRTPNPHNWIIDAALVAPEDRAGWTPEQHHDTGTATFQQLVGTPDLANLERFILGLHGGEVTNYGLTIQGRYTGDFSIAEAESFYAPLPRTAAESERVTERARSVIRRFYLDAPGWRVANQLTVEALNWGERYLCALGPRLFGREIGLRLTWRDPASGNVAYQVEDTVGLVRWESDNRWYLDTDRIGRRVIPGEENRLWLGEPPPPGVGVPEGIVYSAEFCTESLSEEEFWMMISAPPVVEAEETDEDGEGGEVDGEADDDRG